MGLRYNPFTGSFDLTRSPGSYIDGEVAAYSDLPLDAAAAPLNSAWLVRAGSGLWLLTRKPAGIYIRTATGGTDRDADYTYAGVFPDVFNDANFLLYDNGDTTKNLQFQLSGIDTATTRTLTVPNASGTLPLLETANTYTQNQTLDGTNNTAPNQTAASGSSVMTRDLGDARYGQTFLARTTATQTVSNNTTMQSSTQGGDLTLGAGTYQLFFYIRTLNDATAGAKTQVSLSASAQFIHGQEVFGAANGTASVNSAANTNTIGLRQTTNQTSFLHSFSGLLGLTASTTLTIQFANFAASGNTILQEHSFILARKI
jgi:hypothetical protein